MGPLIKTSPPWIPLEQNYVTLQASQLGHLGTACPISLILPPRNYLLLLPNILYPQDSLRAHLRHNRALPRKGATHNPFFRGFSDAWSSIYYRVPPNSHPHQSWFRILETSKLCSYVRLQPYSMRQFRIQQKSPWNHFRGCNWHLRTLQGWYQHNNPPCQNLQIRILKNV